MMKRLRGLKKRIKMMRDREERKPASPAHLMSRSAVNNLTYSFYLELERYKEEQKAERDPHIVGDLLYICPNCRMMLWWTGNKQEVREALAFLRECDRLMCGECGCSQMIDDKARKMMD